VSNRNEISISRVSGSARIDLHGARQQAGSGHEAVPAPAPERPVKLLFLAANPGDTPRLRLDREIKAITEALQASGAGDRFVVEQQWAVEDRQLQDALLGHQPDIVHLSGHGGTGGAPVLERGDAARDIVLAGGPTGPGNAGGRGAALARVFATARGRVRCVVLNACRSLAAADLIAGHVGCAIGMSDAIDDAAALCFSWAFYNALGHGASVRRAFDLALAQLALGGWDRGGDIPRLVAPVIDPTQVSFV
jgi:hypothetical protein